jgi:hypothetical protein
MDKLYVYLVSAVLLVGVGAAVIECGGAVCGNGVKEGDEQCDKGAMNGQPNSGCSADCQLVTIPVASVQVSFELLQSEAPGFLGNTCFDLGIDHWLLELDGPSATSMMLPCLMNQTTFGSIMPGTYTATITLFDKMGNPLTRAVKTNMATVTVGGAVGNLDHDFKQSDFLKQDYTGALYFNPNWGASGDYCAMAGVTQESLTFKNMNGLVAGMTVDGLKLDGTFGPCFTKSGTVSRQEIMGTLPWGHYSLGIQGKDATGAITYCTDFDVFVGAGTATNVYDLVIAAANADAGACP